MTLNVYATRAKIIIKGFKTFAGRRHNGRLKVERSYSRWTDWRVRNVCKGSVSVFTFSKQFLFLSLSLTVRSFCLVSLSDASLLVSKTLTAVSLDRPRAHTHVSYMYDVYVLFTRVCTYYLGESGKISQTGLSAQRMSTGQVSRARG